LIVFIESKLFILKRQETRSTNNSESFKIDSIFLNDSFLLDSLVLGARVDYIHIPTWQFSNVSMVAMV